MLSFTGESFHRTRVAYACLLLLGSSSVAGIAVADKQGSLFVSLSKKISSAFQSTGSSASSSSSSTSAGLGDTAVGLFFKEAGTVVKDGITSTWSTFKELKTTYKDWLLGIKTFFKSLIKPDIYTLLLKNLHMKFYKTLSFFLTEKQMRSTFIDLFKGDQLGDTFKVGKFLLGVENEWKEKFKAAPEVFNYLLFRWLEEPTLVTKKFKTLADEIKKTFNKYQSTGSFGSSSLSVVGGGDGKVYELEQKTVEEYLAVPEGVRETMWILGWKAEILSKLQSGTSIKEFRTGFELLGNLFGGWSW